MSRRHTILGVGLLVAFVTLAGGYSVVLPIGEGVDEAPHLDYVRYVKEHMELPIQPLSRSEVEVWMGHHPPLYYVLGALAISWVDTSDFSQVFRPNPHFVWEENVGSNGWNVMLHFGQDGFPGDGAVLGLHVVRFMTVALGAVAVYAIYRAAQLLFPGQPWAPLGAAALVGLNPSFLFMSSTVHHDTLQAAVFSLAAWWALSLLTGPPRWYDGWIGGLLIGAACLTKLSGLSLVPFVGLTLLLEVWPNREWRRLLRQALTVALVAILVAGWWFARNQWLYGDPLGWRMFLRIHGHMVRRTPYTWQSFMNFMRQIGRTFWGAFGYMHITFPQTTKYLWWLCFLSGLGVVIALLRNEISRQRWREWLLVLVLLATLLISFLRFSMATVGAGHGRYLFPAGISIGALLVTGLNGFTAWRHQRVISILAAVGMAGYAVWLPTKRLLPKYTPPATATKEQLAKAQPTDIVFGQTMELLAYRTSTDLVVPGEWIHVHLYWVPLGRAEERLDPLIRVQLTNDEGGILASSTRWPVPSLPPDAWSPDSVYLTRVSLKAPTECEAGQLRLKVGALSNRGESYLPARVQKDQPARSNLVEISSLPIIGAVKKTHLDNVPNPRHEVFGSELALRGFDIPNKSVSPGGVLPVSLYWEVLEKPSADYTVFIHVLNRSGELVTQFDRPPGGGTAPTSTWQVGEVLRDTYPLKIPATIPSGSFEVYVGMYTWPSLERLSVTADGVSAGDMVRLGILEVESQ